MSERITLDVADAVELIEVFELCCDWFDHDRCRLDHSLRRFSLGLFDLQELRNSLRRFADTIAHAAPAGGDR